MLFGGGAVPQIPRTVSHFVLRSYYILVHQVPYTVALKPRFNKNMSPTVTQQSGTDSTPSLSLKDQSILSVTTATREIDHGEIEKNVYQCKINAVEESQEVSAETLEHLTRWRLSAVAVAYVLTIVQIQQIS